MPLKIAVAGLGFMGKRYVQFLAQMPEVTVTVLCDLRLEVAQPLAAVHGALAFGDIHTLLAQADVDALCICTPEDRHVEAAVAALGVGKAVMIEEPVAHTMAAAAEITAAAQLSHRPVMVGHLLRFEPRWAVAKAAIAAGDLGEIVSISTRRIGNVLDQSILQGRTSIPLYYGVHDLDIARWLVGAEVSALYAARRSGVLHEAGYALDDLDCVVSEFANGALGQAELGWHVPAQAVEAPTSGVVVTGTKGWLRVEQKESGLEIGRIDRGRCTRPLTFSFGTKRMAWWGAHLPTNCAILSIVPLTTRRQLSPCRMARKHCGCRWQWKPRHRQGGA